MVVTKSWTTKDENGKKLVYDYELYFKDNKLFEIRNELGFTIEKNSEVFEYFENEVKNGKI